MKASSAVEKTASTIVGKYDQLNEFKILAFLMDAVNSLIFYSIHLNYVYEGKIKQAAESAKVPLIIMSIVFGILTIIYAVSKIVYKWVTNDYKYRDIFIELIMLLCIWMYFIGDNLGKYTKITKCDAVLITISSCLLAFALLGFRFIPKIDKLCKKNCCTINKETKEKATDADNERMGHLIYYKQAAGILYLVAEIDGWFTAIAQILSNTCDCNSTDNTAQWTAFGIILFCGIFYLFMHGFDYHKKRSTKNGKFISRKDMYCIASTLVFVWFIIGFYLIADNRQPLDCTAKCTCIVGGDMSGCKMNYILRLAFLSFSFLVYLIFASIAVGRWCYYFHHHYQRITDVASRRPRASKTNGDEYISLN